MILLIGLHFHLSTSFAQDPIPSAFLHDVLPNGQQEPGDGAAGVVVEGLCGGLGGRSYDWNVVAFYTNLFLSEHRPTITEISPQGPANCGGATTQDYKNVLLEIVSNVESVSGAEAAQWWGGVMLDEEPVGDFGWSSPTQATTAYVDLNESVKNLMSTEPGISWFYTETFTQTGGWSQADFDAVTGVSYPAPQIATDLMVQVTNAFVDQSPRTVLATWSLDTGYPIRGLTRSATRIKGQPYSAWSMSLSNCFISIATNPPTVCNDFDGDGTLNAFDADSDDDGCSDSQEPHLFLNALDPWDFYSVPVPALINLTNPDGVVADSVVAATDPQAVFAYFSAGAHLGSTVYDEDLNGNGVEDGLEYDRTSLGAPLSGPPNGIVSAGDAQLALAQFRANYRC